MEYKEMGMIRGVDSDPMEGDPVYAAPTQRPRAPESNDANREKRREVPGQRLYFLDWLRIGAFGLLVLYHVGMYYVPWPFHVKSPHPVAGLEPWMRLTEPWRMSLIFLVSGAATANLLRGGSPARWLRRRTRFLLLPLLTGVVLVVPPQTYFEVMQKFGYHDGFLAFLGRYFSVLSNSRDFCAGVGAEARCLVMPTWNHLWFLPYLWCYTVGLCGMVRCFPAATRALVTTLTRELRGAGLFVLPTLWLALCRGVLQPQFPQTHALWGDLYAHAMYGFAFGMGALLMRMEDGWSRLAAARRVALVVAALAWTGLVFMPRHPSSSAWFVALFQWSAITALLGLAVAHFDRDAPIRPMLAEAVFPVYLVHQTVMIVFSQVLLGWSLPVGVEALVLLSATGGISFGVYQLVRRQAFLRPWFGLRNRSHAR
ncbi:acyltransferase family protein [Sphaerotilus sp.]|uniref:acyltransferase family protein n=1 Tax=Sphaerotilus sp. TaxID=2093942 RepID=UPI0034E28129